MKNRVPIFVVFLCCFATAVLTFALLLWSMGFPSSSDRTDSYPGSFNGVTAGMGSSNAAMDSMEFAPSNGASAGSYDSDFAAKPEMPESVADGRKLIRRASVSVETTEYDTYVNWLDSYVAGIGGYFEERSQRNLSGYYDSDYRVLDATIRVPVSQLDALLNSLAVEGNVTDRSETQEDITQSYTDVDAHLASIRIEQTRLNELLSIAESVEDILAIEDRLSYVRYEIENYERQLRSYDSQIEYSVVRVRLMEVIKYTEPTPEGFLARCVSTFRGNLEWLGTFTQDAVVFIVGHIPAMLTGAVVIFVAIKVVRVVKSKKGKKSGGDGSEL